MIELSYFAAFTVVFFFCIRILHMNSRVEWPHLTYLQDQFEAIRSATAADDTPTTTHRSSASSSSSDDSDGFVSQILKHAPIFSRPYVPPLLWGRSGHLQTIIHSTFGRHKVPREKGDSRHEIHLSDGSTVTFDLFQPLTVLPVDEKDHVTLMMCPGIGNSSETVSIRTFAHHANERGMRVAVLNHLGVIPNIPLTTPRIFNYGSTEEYGAMVEEVSQWYPDSLLIGVGFSMGGNLVCKYMGESEDHRCKFIGMISCCQGYDIARLLDLMQTWKHLAKGYMRAITMCVEKVLYNFRHVLLNDEVLAKYGLQHASEVLGCADVTKMDELLLSRLAGHRNSTEYYKWASSSEYIPQIDIPSLFINALDDPIVPCAVLDVPSNHAKAHPLALFVTTKHGGHLGFFESQNSSIFHRGTYTWLDKAIMEYAEALVTVTQQQKDIQGVTAVM